MSTQKEDYYKLLGLEKTATDAEIKTAFRNLSKKYHPDMQAGKTEEEKKIAEDKFKALAEAYETLSNKEKRERYDTFGAEDECGNNNSYNGFADFMKHHSDMFSNDFFNFNPFGSNFSRQHNNINDPRPGRDIQLEMNISFEDSIFGVTKEFDLPLDEICSECHGTGSADGVAPTECDMCHGTGTIIGNHGQNIIIQQTCPKCNGSGVINKNPCHKCRGEKKVPATKHFVINIPKGINTGQKLRISEGLVGLNGGKSGNIYIVILVSPSSEFTRVGDNLYKQITINSLQAIVGCKIDIKTPYKTVTVKIPSGTQYNDEVVISKEGVKTKSKTGDLHIQIIIKTPTNLTSDQVNDIKEIQKTLTT